MLMEMFNIIKLTYHDERVKWWLDSLVVETSTSLTVTEAGKKYTMHINKHKHQLKMNERL